MHIIHISAEMAPIAKVGGLGDVIQGLSRAVAKQEHQVSVLLPKYDTINTSSMDDFALLEGSVKSTYQNTSFETLIWKGTVQGIEVYFIDPQHPRHFFNRGCYYGCDDDLERFLCFCRCCLDFLYTKKIAPEIIHLHDWQTAAIALLYKDLFQSMGYRKPKIVTSIHNIAYQGLCGPHDLTAIGLEGSRYITPELMQDSTYPEAGNLLKGAIVFSDYTTTVSPTYAEEVLHPDKGMTLESTILAHKDKFQGILNGIDYDYWNPETDPYLSTHFSNREKPKNKKDHAIISNKAYVKKVLRDRLMLSHAHKPLVSCICRLVPQKGIEFIKHAIINNEKLGIQFVLLGVSPVPSIDEEFHHLKHIYEDSPNVHIRLHHHEELAHMIFAASDITLVPSLFEPCGLTQMIALRYGSIPLVRKTGGLSDTVFDINTSEKPFEETNGFSFDEPTIASFDSTLKRAIAYWYHDPQLWRALVIQGMRINFSWDHSAKKYLEVYSSLLL